jgi:hypothetical protein
MTKLFAILPSWVWALALAGALAAYGVTGNQLRIERGAHLQTRLTHAEQVSSAQAARANEEAARRQTEQELIDATEIHAKEVEAVLADRAADRRAGAAVAVRLRDAARATAELAGQVRADSTAAELREAAADAARMLAQLREESDERSGILARALDDAHLAGNACVTRYEEAREALTR